MKEKGQVNIIAHPIIEHKVAILRDKNTDSYSFRRAMLEVSTILAYEATRDVKLKNVEIKTPLTSTKAKKIGEEIVLAPILRAGMGMLDAFLEMIPNAHTGHIGIYRDKFIKNTVEYYFKLPKNVEGKKTFLLDPMVATGDTALASIARLKQYGVGDISLCSILLSKEGLNKISEAYSNVTIYCFAIEKKLTPEGHLWPGIGDAGSRLYETK